MNKNIANPFSVCFNMLKIKYVDFDETITRAKFLKEGDKINLFINLESVFKYISMIQDLEKRIILERNHNVIFVSDTLNLAAHYKRFFVNNGFDVRIYFYYTSFDSEDFPEEKYNTDYRNYYLTKYNRNPKFVLLSDELKQTVLKDIKTYCEFIPRVYCIEAKDVEGSLIPYIVAQDDMTRKNIIIQSDFFETQYSLIPSFMSYYFHRSTGPCQISSSISEHLSILMKKEKKDIQSFTDIVSTYFYYCSLLSIIGDRTRSIDGITGIGPKTFEKILYMALESHAVTKDITNPKILADAIFSGDEDKRTEFIDNFYQTSILSKYEELQESTKISLLSQRKDRYDINSLQKLNATIFYNHPLILEALLL